MASEALSIDKGLDVRTRVVQNSVLSSGDGV